MKKIVTIVVLALALTLVASFALAANYAGSLTLGELYGVLWDSASTINGYKNITKVEPSIEELEKKDFHNSYIDAKVYGLKDSTTGWTNVRVIGDGHWWLIDEEASTFQNCEEGGILVEYCGYRGCDATRTTVYPKAPHSMVEKNTATCLKDGYYYDECARCGWIKKNAVGEIIYKTDADGKLIVAPKFGAHNVPADLSTRDKNYTYTTDVACSKTSTDLQPGKVYVTCKRCGEKVEVLDVTNAAYPTNQDKANAVATFIPNWTVKNGHTFETKPYKVFGATCEVPGGKSYWCSRCGDIYDEYDKNQPALGHQYGLMTYVSCGQDPYDVYFWCTRCEEDDTIHPAAWADKYDKDGNPIGYVFTYTDAETGLTYSAEFTHDYVPTGEAHYEVPGWWGTDDMAELKNQNWSSAKKVEFCETATKWYEVKCSFCDRTEWFETANKHNYGPWTITDNKEDYGTKTSRFQRVCEWCGNLDVRTSEDVPCDEHDYQPADPTKVKCKSMNTGIQLKCTKCGDVKTGDYPVVDHDYKELSVVVPATCSKGGSSIFKCSICGDLKEMATSPKAHDLVAVEAKEPTCKDKGYEAYWTCTVCGKYFSDDKGTTIIKTPVAIDKTDKHVWNDGVVTKEATVEADGVKTYTCTICGATKTETITKLVPPTEIDELKTEFDKKDNILSGKAAVKEGTQEPKALFARITLFFANGTYNVGSVQLADDGTFEIPTAGDVVHYAVQIVDSNKVRPGTYNTFSTTEADVK